MSLNICSFFKVFSPFFISLQFLNTCDISIEDPIRPDVSANSICLFGIRHGGRLQPLKYSLLATYRLRNINL